MPPHPIRGRDADFHPPIPIHRRRLLHTRAPFDAFQTRNPSTLVCTTARTRAVRRRRDHRLTRVTCLRGSAWTPRRMPKRERGVPWSDSPKAVRGARRVQRRMAKKAALEQARAKRRDERQNARERAKKDDDEEDDDEEVPERPPPKKRKREVVADQNSPAPSSRRGEPPVPFSSNFWSATNDDVSPNEPNEPNEATSWNDPRLPPSFLEFRTNSKDGPTLNEPTPVQRRLWVAALQGKDAVAVAPTGSGKTLAFTLPIVPHVLAALERARGPISLILAPTRELVAQIGQTCRDFKRLFNIRVHTAYGGVASDANELALSDVLVATVGRAHDVIVMQRNVTMKRVTFVVLDEADKMLQMGFKQNLEDISSMIRQNRQTLMTTATMSSEANAAAEAWLKPDAERIVVGALDLNVSLGHRSKVAGSPNHQQGNDDDKVDATDGHHQEKPTNSITISDRVTQTVHLCAEHKKPRKLIRHIERIKAAETAETEEKGGGRRQPGPMLVFCNKIKTVQFVNDFLKRQGIRCATLHGGMKQPDRERTLAEFKAGKHACLVATDVAARGLHVSALEHVVNWDFPTSLAQYAHRVGRAGRGARSGTALSFFTRNLAPMAPDLIKLLRATNQAVDPNLAAFVGELEEPPVATTTRSTATEGGDDDDEEEEHADNGEVDEKQTDEVDFDVGFDGDDGMTVEDQNGGDDDDDDDNDDDDDDEAAPTETHVEGAKPLVKWVPSKRR